MAEKPEEVNAWLDDEDGNRAADLTLKADDYTESVKLPATKPGWMQRAHAYTAGGEELEGWTGPELKTFDGKFELVYENKIYILPTLKFLSFQFYNNTSSHSMFYVYIDVFANEKLFNTSRFVKTGFPAGSSSTNTYICTHLELEDEEVKSFSFIIRLTGGAGEETVPIIEAGWGEYLYITCADGETHSFSSTDAHLTDEGYAYAHWDLNETMNVEDIEEIDVEQTTIYV